MLGNEQSNVLQVRDLHVEVKTKNGAATLVQDINFELKRGEVLGLVGQSATANSFPDFWFNRRFIRISLPKNDIIIHSYSHIKRFFYWVMTVFIPFPFFTSKIALSISSSV